MKSTLLCLFMTLAAFASAQADDTRGRLPDGRAFRTDAEGVQIVDYIAELELSIEALNRRVKGLETELEEKQQQLDRVSRGADAEPEIKERDLLQDNGRKAAAECPPCDYESRFREAERQVSMLERDLQAERAKAAGYSKEVSARMQQDQSCEARIQETALAARAGEEKLRLYEQELASVRAALRRQETLLAERPSQIDALRAGGSEQQLMTPAAPPSAPPTGGAFGAQLVSAAAAAPAAPRRAQFSPDRARALASVKADLQSEINRLQGLIAQRSGKFKQYQAKPRGVQFELSPLNVNNRSLDYIRSRADQSHSMRELSSLRGDVRVLQSKVNDDVLLMERLMK